MQSILMILLMVTALGGCHKEDVMPDPPDPVEKEVFELEWATRLANNGSVVQTNDPRFVYDDNYIDFGNLDDNILVSIYDKNTGEHIEDIVVDEYESTSVSASYILGNVLVAIHDYGIAGIDLRSNEIVWEIKEKVHQINTGKGNLYKDKVYISIIENFNKSGEFSYLMEVDCSTGDFRKLVAKSTNSVGTKYMSPPVFRETSEGTIMYYNEYPNYDAPPQRSMQSIVAYNLDQGEEVWRNESFITEWATNSLHAPVIYEDLIITGGNWSIYAFNRITGEEEWRYQLPGYDFGGNFWTTTNHLLVGDKLYVNPLSEEVVCIDAKTGEEVWMNKKGGANCTDNMLYYKDMLVFTSWGYGSVMVIDALTGKTIHRERPYENSNFNNDIAYDPETDMFFTSTYKHALGFKINKPE